MSFSKVPVVDVHSENFQEVWPSMMLAMSSANYIALDTELSGLGQRKLLQSKSVEDRYKAITETAKSRSILSLGIACFKREPKISETDCPSAQHSEDVGCGGQCSETDQSRPSYSVQTYNIWTLCEDEYVVEPASLKFLVDHGFDFNRQYSKGVSYHRGPDKETDKSYPSIRQLFIELVRLGSPLTLHNGLVDLIFLYENLYTTAPATLPAFLADLVDLFPGGILDSKCITDFEHRMPASYLEYVYRKCQRDNAENEEDGVLINFPSYLASHRYVTYRNCQLKSYIPMPAEQLQSRVCGSYAGHGWCSKGPYCPLSHDIDLILDLDGVVSSRKSRKRKKRKNKKKQKDSCWTADTDQCVETKSVCNTDTEMPVDSASAIENSVPVNVSDIHSVDEAACVNSGDKTGTNQIPDNLSDDQDDSKLTNQNAAPVCIHCNRHMEDSVSGGHRAGYDAFMTGFIVATYLGRRDIRNAADNTVKEWRNKLYLSGKDYPLTVMKSSFAKSSKEHLEKIAKIRTMHLC